MNNFEIILIALSLASDAFAVSVSKGLSINKLKISYIAKVGVFFGLFQSIMPILGFYLSLNIGKYLIRYNHLIGFIILFIIGLSSFLDKKEEGDDRFDLITMTILAISTSIDAFTIGVTASLMVTDIYFPSLIIGIITLLLSSLGIILGNKLKDKIKIPAKKIGGIILILIGLNMLIEYLHLF